MSVSDVLYNMDSCMVEPTAVQTPEIVTPLNKPQYYKVKNELTSVWLFCIHIIRIKHTTLSKSIMLLSSQLTSKSIT